MRLSNAATLRLRAVLTTVTWILLIPAQLMFGDSGGNARGAGLPLVALRALAMQASIGGADGVADDSGRGIGVFYVSNQKEFDAAVKQAEPGDTLVMGSGVWKDADLRFRGTGKPDAPITLRAETPGEVILSGASKLSIVGRHLVVKGLLFKDDAPSAKKSSPVVSFRGDGIQSHHCRMTDCAVVDFNPPDKEKDTRWVSLYGTHNRVDHCCFHNKTNLGTTVVVWLNDPPDHEPNYHRIDHNCFSLRPRLGMNGAETIRIGTSGRSMLDSRTVVEDNCFYRCNGEGEIISNKSCENSYRANTFVECEGALTLRHGNRCTVEGNFFLGNGARLTGGVRVIGEDHRVVNNYFCDLAGDGYRASLTFMEGIQDSELGGYFQVKNVLVAFNTFVNNRQTFNLGYGTGRKGQVMPPKHCVIANNLVLGGRSPLITVHDPAMTVSFIGNVMHGAELGLPPTPGIRRLDPKLVKGEDGLWRPVRDSPILGAAEGRFATIVVDMDGQPRGSPTDVGADHRSDQPVKRVPLAATDVGPPWLELPQVGVRSGSRETSGVWEASGPNSHESGYPFSQELTSILQTRSCASLELPLEF